MLGVPRKNGALNIWKHKERCMILMKASANWIIVFIAIPHEVVCKHFAYVLGTANSANYWSGPYPSYVWYPVKDSLFPVWF